MADGSVTTISGVFSTREGADAAVEHLVQQHGINRADIFVQAAQAENTSGTAPSGGDVARDEAEGSAFEASLSGSIEVSADVAAEAAAAAEEAFRDAGAAEVKRR